MSEFPKTAAFPTLLEGLLVVCIEHSLSSSLRTGRFAEMGARVIKIERTEGHLASGDDTAESETSRFVWTNRGSELLITDFNKPADAQLLHRLLSRADVVVRNLAQGASAPAEFDNDRLLEHYPHLVTCDISEFGAYNEALGLKIHDLRVNGLPRQPGPGEAPERGCASTRDIDTGTIPTISELSALAIRKRAACGSRTSASQFDGTADFTVAQTSKLRRRSLRTTVSIGESKVLSSHGSQSRPTRGIVTVETTGINQDGVGTASFERATLYTSEPTFQKPTQAINLR